jgi:hypothetical protein
LEYFFCFDGVFSHVATTKLPHPEEFWAGVDFLASFYGTVALKYTFFQKTLPRRLCLIIFRANQTREATFLPPVIN